MEQQIRKTWTFFFAFLACLDIRLDGAAKDYRKLMSFAAFLNCFFSKPDELGADARLPLRTLAQPVLNCSDPVLEDGEKQGNKHRKWSLLRRVKSREVEVQVQNVKLKKR